MQRRCQANVAKGAASKLSRNAMQDFPVLGTQLRGSGVAQEARSDSQRRRQGGEALCLLGVCVRLASNAGLQLSVGVSLARSRVCVCLARV